MGHTYWLVHMASRSTELKGLEGTLSVQQSCQTTISTGFQPSGDNCYLCVFATDTRQAIFGIISISVPISSVLDQEESTCIRLFRNMRLNLSALNNPRLRYTVIWPRLCFNAAKSVLGRVCNKRSSKDICFWI